MPRMIVSGSHALDMDKLTSSIRELETSIPWRVLGLTFESAIGVFAIITGSRNGVSGEGGGGAWKRCSDQEMPAMRLEVI